VRLKKLHVLFLRFFLKNQGKVVFQKSLFCCFESILAKRNFMKFFNYLRTNNIALIFAASFSVIISHLSFGQNNLIIKPVNPVSNPLIDSLVGQLVGGGVIVQNVRSNLTETSKAIGTFKAPVQLFGGIRGGLVMTTGQADTMAGANTGGIISVQLPPTDTVAGCSEGRQMLNSVLNFNATTTRRTTNCATIQFDIIPSSDSIKFNYVFASEEYNNFVCSNFNDIFGFFITGPGITGDQNLAPDFPQSKNIALIPGTNLPVSINTVNNGTPGTSGTAANCNFTPQGIASYIDNTPAPGTNNPFVLQRLRFNGLTKVLTAGVKVTPCEVYTLTLTVSDVTDGSFDSGVFIEKGSLRSSVRTSVSTQYNDRFPYAIVNCNPGKIFFKRCYTVDRAVIRYTIGGSAVNDVDYKEKLETGNLQALADSLVLIPGQETDSIVLLGQDNPGWENTPQKKVVLRFLNFSNPFVNGQPNFNGDSAVMLIRRKFIYNNGADMEICQFTDTSIRPLTPAYPGDRYLWKELNAAGDTITTTDLSCTTCRVTIAGNDTTKTFVVFVTDSASQCITADTVTIKVQPIPKAQFSSIPSGFSVCRNQRIVLQANPPTANSTWRYEWINILPENSTGLIDSASRKNRTLDVSLLNKAQFFPVRIKTPLGCLKEDSVQVRILEKPAFSLKDADTLCYGTPYRITAVAPVDSIGAVQYSWINSDDRRIKDSTGISVSFRALQSGRYILTGDNKCFSNDGIARDTLNLFVFDSISTAFDYKILNDGLTVSPVLFSNKFIPFSYPRIWRLYNDSLSYNQVLDGQTPIIEISNGGNYTAEAVIYNRIGNYFCSDTTRKSIIIDPLGQVYLPNYIFESNLNSNSTFRITARDENGKELREITDGSLTIYNRWGKEMYKIDKYENNLKSTELKEKLGIGVYFYEFNSPRYNFKTSGWFNVQR
jgi:hypothetical protein